MEMTLVKANIEENTKDTMTHFMNGLNPDIRDVELHEYVELDDLFHKAAWVEQQLKREIAARRNSSNNFNQNWTNRSKNEGGNSFVPMESQQFLVLEPSIILHHHPTLVPVT